MGFSFKILVIDIVNIVMQVLKHYKKVIEQNLREIRNITYQKIDKIKI